MGKIILLALIGLIAIGIGFLSFVDVQPERKRFMREIPLETPAEQENARLGR
ncbi:MAG: hypothetical protein KDD76_07195 [Rickettsiales bacterium]|nr:hypothetical protein [Rickettsiales bacterium]